MSIDLLKHALRKLILNRKKLANGSKRTPQQINLWFKWLSPGLLVKRWLAISAIGFVLVILGLAIWTKLTPISRLIELTSEILETITTFIPNWVSGPIALALGLFLVFWGQTRTVGSVAEALQPDSDRELVDVLLAHRRLNRGPKIVAIGGGTGLSTLQIGRAHV